MTLAVKIINNIQKGNPKCTIAVRLGCVYIYWIQLCRFIQERQFIFKSISLTVLELFPVRSVNISSTTIVSPSRDHPPVLTWGYCPQGAHDQPLCCPRHTWPRCTPGPPPASWRPLSHWSPPPPSSLTILSLKTTRRICVCFNVYIQSNQKTSSSIPLFSIQYKITKKLLLKDIFAKLSSWNCPLVSPPTLIFGITITPLSIRYDAN